MEMKDKNELLDTGDDGDDGNEVGEGGDKDDVSYRAIEDGDRMNELLEAIKALPDLLEGVVKQEVSQLPGVLKGLMQEIQSTRGQSNNEAPLTDARDPISYVEQEVDANVSTE
ncbi:hypothetical protein LWI28_004693 [Acer negundo]|uniref:Uncharacterized protein n=1 Tax=Acer negundo TaxID=4023 RepID=A0AAD5ILC8_ACENE|nr:hypothetical protein LWI28_004693 [Acer negundo]